MTPSGMIFGLLRRFAGQVVVSVAATVCATGIYGHFISAGGSLPTPPAPFASRVEGGVIESRNVAYYPEHLAALDSLSRFHPLSVQRTAELSDELRSMRVASVSDGARPRRESADVLPPARPMMLAQVTVLPPRRPVMAATATTASAPAPVTVAAGPAEPTSGPAKIWGVELPRFVPTGASVIDKLASMKDRIGGLIHVSSR
ncbi:MAG: hypothetical protein QOC72_2592 [Methylobacteriaceae bacterium]|nr:hypothetical protein [Methylobacteriaceae bacterium]